MRGSALRMEFRYLTNTVDLNSHGTLHGGTLMKWIAESVGIHAKMIGGFECVVRHIGRVDFVSKVKKGEIIRIETITDDFGESSFAFRVYVKEEDTSRRIANIDKIVYVAVDEDGAAVKHGLKFSDLYGL